MKLVVVRTPTWKSPYGRNGALVSLPSRMRWLHPIALESLLLLGSGLIFTDVFRSPAASLEARKRKRGVQKPGHSAHNFGLAVDLDVGRTLSQNATRRWDKAMLDTEMLKAGWRCYRADHALNKPESWHYSFGADGHGSAAIEQIIQRSYRHHLKLRTKDAQLALASLRLYQGGIDGIIGPQSRAAIEVFQRGWLLPVTGELDEETQRLLAVASATLPHVDALEA